MPQVSFKCRRLSRVCRSAAPAGNRIRCSKKRFQATRQTKKTNSGSVPNRFLQEEDWEKEIEQEKEKKQSSETPYDAEEALKVALCEMCLYSVPGAPRPHPQHYNPSQHHTLPVRWIQHVSSIETDQFVDAEEETSTYP